LFDIVLLAVYVSELGTSQHVLAHSLCYKLVFVCYPCICL